MLQVLQCNILPIADAVLPFWEVWATRQATEPLIHHVAISLVESSSYPDPRVYEEQYSDSDRAALKAYRKEVRDLLRTLCKAEASLAYKYTAWCADMLGAVARGR